MSGFDLAIIFLGSIIGLVIGLFWMPIYKTVNDKCFVVFRNRVDNSIAVMLSNICAVLVSLIFILVGLAFAPFIPDEKWHLFSNPFLLGVVLGIWLFSRK